MEKTLYVYEIARELRITTNSILEYLDFLGYDVSRHQMQPLNDEMYYALLEKFDKHRLQRIISSKSDDIALRTNLTALKQRLNSVREREMKKATEREGRKVKPVAAVAKVTQPKQPEKPEKPSVIKVHKEEIIVKEKAPMSVSGAFTNLLNVIQTEIKTIVQSSASAMERGNFDSSRQHLLRGAELSGFLDKVAALQKEWPDIAGVQTEEKVDTPVKPLRRRRGLAKGSLTRTKVYYLPMLQSIVNLGGSARKSDVLVQLEELMRSTLNKLDYEAPPSHPKIPRWRIKADKVRDLLIKEELLNRDSDPGVWEINSKGKAYLESGGMK